MLTYKSYWKWLFISPSSEPLLLVISRIYMNLYPIPNNLRRHRKQAGLRQVDVADKLGFKSADRISKWEKGQAIPNIVNLFKLVLIYQTPAEELYWELIEEIRKK